MPPVAENDIFKGSPSGALAGVRSDFPILSREIGGRPLIYLDSAASSQKPQVVIDAQAEHLRSHNANVHRGVYALAQEADAAYDGARGRVAAFVGGLHGRFHFRGGAGLGVNFLGSRAKEMHSRATD